MKTINLLCKENGGGVYKIYVESMYSSYRGIIQIEIGSQSASFEQELGYGKNGELGFLKKLSFILQIENVKNISFLFKPSYVTIEDNNNNFWSIRDMEISDFKMTTGKEFGDFYGVKITLESFGEYSDIMEYNPIMKLKNIEM